MVPIVQAARSLGVPVDLVKSQVERGQLPAIRDGNGQWLVERSAVDTLATSQGLQLDLRAGEEPIVIPTQSDVLAAQAAVLLAKTQATAARSQSQDFFRRMRDADESAAADRKARHEADQALAEAERSLQELRSSQAVADAKVQELRSQLAKDDRHFQFMVDRISSLEWERHRLTQCLGWFGRIRFRRMVQNPRATLTSDSDQVSLVNVDPEAAPSVGSADPNTAYPPPQTREPPVGGNADHLATVRSVESLA